MNRLSKVYCDYCGFELKEETKDRLILAYMVVDDHYRQVKVDICGACLLLRLQAVLNAYRLEDEFLRDVLGLVPASIPPGWKFSHEAINPSSPLWKSGIPRPRLSQRLPVSASIIREGLPENEEQLREEIDILKEQRDRLEEDKQKVHRSLLKTYARLEDAIGELRPGLESVMKSVIEAMP